MKFKHAINNFYQKFFSKEYSESTSYLYDLGSANWSNKGYRQFVDEAYKKNVVASRCVSLIAKSAASVGWCLTYKKSQHQKLLIDHPILDLLHHPNPMQGGAEFFEALYSYKMLAGNSYILALRNNDRSIRELHLLRPDRVEVMPGKGVTPKGYLYKINNREILYPVDQITGCGNVLHLRNFGPDDDWYGLSQIESAAYSIDLHNQASAWNKSLLQNGARPSGAMIVKGAGNAPGYLTDQQFTRLTEQLEMKFMGSGNAGRPLILEGGLEWKEMGYSPKDMDFIETKNAAARDIALAFGVPPQLLGIKGDNTYNNMQEARLAFWEETVLPLVDHTIDSLNNWLRFSFSSDLKLFYRVNDISALSMKYDRIWQRVSNANFMTDQEKRVAVGLVS